MSFEHIPPESAFNNTGILFSDINLELDIGRNQIVNIERRRGLGAHTLCKRCNNSTGRVYATSFIDWVKDSCSAVKIAGHLPVIQRQWRNFYPLRVIKQIATMVFSANSENFHKIHPELQKFTLNKYVKNLSPRYHFFLYFNHTGRKRMVGNAAMINIATKNPTYISEITFPPFGYVFTIDSLPSDKRLLEISHFSNYNFDQKTNLYLEVPVLPTITQYPGDYRTEKEVLSQAGFSPVLTGRQEIPNLIY
ncbi:MAG: hypothetical protein ACYDBP_06640 [Leptospirales bacterium]